MTRLTALLETVTDNTLKRQYKVALKIAETAVTDLGNVLLEDQQLLAEKQEAFGFREKEMEFVAKQDEIYSQIDVISLSLENANIEMNYLW